MEIICHLWGEVATEKMIFIWQWMSENMALKTNLRKGSIIWNFWIIYAEKLQREKWYLFNNESQKRKYLFCQYYNTYHWLIGLWFTTIVPNDILYESSPNHTKYVRWFIDGRRIWTDIITYKKLAHFEVYTKYWHIKYDTL